MQTNLINCDKTQGTVEIALNKREIQMDKVIISLDYELVSEKKYKAIVYGGFTDFDIQKELNTIYFNCNYSDLFNIINSTVCNWMNDKKFKQQLRNIIKQLRISSAIGFEPMRFYKFNILDGYQEYKDISILVEVSKDRFNVYKSVRKTCIRFILK